MEPPENAVSFNEIQPGAGVFQIRFPGLEEVGVNGVFVTAGDDALISD